MKGQSEAISTILLTLVGISVVSTVYLYGVPLIEKNKDVTVLRNSEDFIFLLNEKIKEVSNGGSTEISFNIPGILEFDNTNNCFLLTLRTAGTIYASDAKITLNRNYDILPGDVGVWGENEMEMITVFSEKVNNEYQTTYNLSYIPIEGNDCYLIDMFSSTGNNLLIGENHIIRIEFSDINDDNQCSDLGVSGNKKLLKSEIEISFI